MRTTAFLLLSLVIMLPACGADSGTDAAVDSGTSVDSGTGVDSATDAGADNGTVTGSCDLPSFDRSCGAAADCVAAVHQTDCCGTFITTGLSHSQQAGFDAFEAACRATYPLCRCAAGPTAADDHTTGSGAANVSCVSGTCTTSFAP